MNYVDVVNAIEVIWWPAAGFAVLARSWQATPDWRRLGIVAGLTLILFGISDAVELSTKAWWRPWWLLVWKGLCIVTLVACALIRKRRLRSDQP